MKNRTTVLRHASRAREVTRLCRAEMKNSWKIDTRLLPPPVPLSTTPAPQQYPRPSPTSTHPSRGPHLLTPNHHSHSPPHTVHRLLEMSSLAARLVSPSSSLPSVTPPPQMNAAAETLPCLRGGEPGRSRSRHSLRTVDTHQATGTESKQAPHHATSPVRTPCQHMSRRTAGMQATPHVAPKGTSHVINKPPPPYP